MNADTMQAPVLSCEVCGVTNETKNVTYRKRFDSILCDKHYCQMKCYGRITNPSSRSCFDKNEYRIDGDIVYMDLYNRQEEVVCVVRFDRRFLPYIKDRKWRPVWKTCKYYAVTIGSQESGLSHEYMHRIIAQLGGLNIDGLEVDHIDGDSMNNLLSNLRPATAQEQKLNMKPKSDGKIPVRGVSYNKKENKYTVDFRAKGKRYYSKQFDTPEEAAYARYVYERELIGDYSLKQSLQFLNPYISRLSDSEKQVIERYVLSRISLTDQEVNVS